MYNRVGLGVLFALKVLMNAYFPNDDQRFMGWLPIPSKYACWAELILIQVLSPNVSFVGHLAGILVGLMYTMGPLRYLTDIVCSLAMPQFNTAGGHHATAPPEEDSDDDRDQPGSSWGGVPFAGRGATIGGAGRTTGVRYEQFTGGLSEEEQIRRATEESLRNRRNYGWNLE